MICKGFRKCHTTRVMLSNCNKCMEETKESKPTVSEKGISYSIDNNNSLTLLKYKVDGGLIDGVEQIRCDYLMMFPECLKAFYIELKGQGWKKAIDQLENTFKLVQPEMKEYTPHLRAVVIQGVPNTRYNPLAKISKVVKRQYPGATIELKSRFNDAV